MEGGESVAASAAAAAVVENPWEADDSDGEEWSDSGCEEEREEHEEIKPGVEPYDIYDVTPRTVNSVFLETTTWAASKNAIVHIDNRTYTWAEYRAEAFRVAKAVVAFRMKNHIKGRPRVLMMMLNSPTYLFIHTGIILGGGIPVNLPYTFTPQIAASAISATKPRLAFVDFSGVKYRDKLSPAFQEFGHITWVNASVDMLFMSFSADEKEALFPPIQLSAFLEDAKSVGVTDSHLERIARKMKPEMLCEVVFSVQEDGSYLPVKLSHSNVTFTAAASNVFASINSSDRVVCLLPLFNISEQMLACHCPMRSGATTFFCASNEERGRVSIQKLHTVMKLVNPTVFVSVPRIFEKLISGIDPKLTSKAEGSFGRWAFKKGRDGIESHESGSSKHSGFGFAGTMLRRFKKDMGLDDCKYCGVWGPCSDKVYEFMAKIGIVLHNFFGLPETCGVAISTKHLYWAEDSIGIPINDQVKVRIESDDEITISGPNVFMGYMGGHKMAEGEYFHTGFTGSTMTVNSNTVFKLSGRKKLFLITGGGVIVAPRPIEDMMMKIPGTKGAVLVGEGEKFVAAIVNLDKEVTGDSSAYKQSLDETVNPYFPNTSHVHRFAILREGHTPLSSSLTYAERLQLYQRINILLFRLYNKSA